MNSARTNTICALLLTALTLLLYWGILGNDFINYDDLQYVVDNPHVATGVSPANVAWAFTTGHAANWHPLTWLSHMLDAQLFGLEPQGHHLVSLIIHCANACLLFLFLQAATGARWRSLLVAALFALHPLHVESVAWVAERKDVLSTFFEMLALLAYLRYARGGERRYYGALLLLFALGLMAKPMLVTLPFVLLLLDYWPLRRLQWGRQPFAVETATAPSRLVMEKLPLFALSALSCAVTFVVQAKGEAVHTLQITPLSFRIANAAVAYVGYLLKALWPRDLAVLYPLPKEIPLPQSLTAAVALLAISAAACLLSRRRPYLLTGWFWFLGTLIPVIGLVQVGIQSMADRYTYFPLIGFFIIAVWGFADLAERFAALKVPLAVAAAALLVFYGSVTWSYQRCWKDSQTLFIHTIASTTGNYYAHYLLGNARYEYQRYDEALAEYRQALKLEPLFAEAFINTGITHAKLGREREAVEDFTAALALKPASSYVHYNLAVALQKEGRLDEAVPHYQEVVRRNPDNVEASFNLGLALAALKRCDEAAAQFGEVLRMRPDLRDAAAEMAKCGR